MARCLLVSVGLVAAVFSGCGPSKDNVVDKYRPAMDTLREKLQRIAAKVPRRVLDQSAAMPLDPPLVMIEEGHESNTEVLMFEEVENEYAQLEFDLRLSNDLHACLYWTRREGSAGRGDGTHMQEAFERTISTRYLVVHRVGKLELPRVVRGSEYTPGHITVEGSVFDLQTEELLATYVIDAQAKNNIVASSRDGESWEEAVERFANSSLWEVARERAAEKLARVTNGTVQFGRQSKRYEPAVTAPPPSSQPPIAPPVATVQPPATQGSPVQPLHERPLHTEPLGPRKKTLIGGSPERLPRNPAAPSSDSSAPTVPTLVSATQIHLRSLPVETAEVLVQDEHRLLRDFRVTNVPFQNGLYAHPPAAKQSSRVVISLGKKFGRLQGAAGQSDGAPLRSFSPLTFRIVGDDRELWRSEALQRHGEWRPFDVDVSDVDRLELFVDCPGDHSFAWGVWMDPVLTKK